MAQAAIHEIGIGAARDAGGRWNRFVDLAIAIVIDSVAGFIRGIDITHAPERRTNALDRSECTRRGIALTAGRADPGNVVDDSIAVVVFTIA